MHRNALPLRKFAILFFIDKLGCLNSNTAGETTNRDKTDPGFKKQMYIPSSVLKTLQNVLHDQKGRGGGGRRDLQSEGRKIKI